jgi:hypothetical protein
MKINLLLPFLLLIFLALGASAQTEKGSMITGTNVGISYTSQDSLHSFDMNFNPNFGYFVANNFMMGMSVGIGITSDNKAKKLKNRLFINTSFAPFVRYYFLKEKWRPFLYARFGYFGTTLISNGNTSSSDGLTGEGGVGINYFFNKNAAFEATLGYRGTRTTGQSLNSRFGLGLGVQLFFHPKIKPQDRNKY